MTLSRYVVRIGLCAVVTGLALPAGAQVRPHAITGAPSSAMHCRTGNAADIYSLGWIDAGTHYTITFDADFDIVASIVRFDLAQNQATLGDGGPEFNATASTSGAMVLHVTSNSGASGCYRYSVAIGPPVAGTNSVATDVNAGVKNLEPLETDSLGPLAISGAPSSGQHCVAGNSPNVHEIGHIDQDGQVTVTFDANFDALAGMTRTSFDPINGSAGHFRVDDNSGGGTNPALTFTVNAGDNVVLYVVGVNTAAGCYRYKVEIR